MQSITRKWFKKKHITTQLFAEKAGLSYSEGCAVRQGRFGRMHKATRENILKAFPDFPVAKGE